MNEVCLLQMLTFFKCGVGYIVLYFIEVCCVEFAVRKVSKMGKKMM